MIEVHTLELGPAFSQIFALMSYLIETLIMPGLTLSTQLSSICFLSSFLFISSKCHSIFKLTAFTFSWSLLMIKMIIHPIKTDLNIDEKITGF